MANLTPQAAEAATTTKPKLTSEERLQEFLSQVNYDLMYKDLKAVRKQKKFKDVGYTIQWMEALEVLLFFTQKVGEKPENV